MPETEHNIPEPVSPQTMQKLAFVGSVILCIQGTLGLFVAFLLIDSSPSTKGSFVGVFLQLCLVFYLTYRVKKDDSSYAATWLLVMLAFEMFLNFLIDGDTIKYVLAAIVAFLIFPYANHNLRTKN